MAIWRYSPWDAVMFALSILHTVATITLVVYWNGFTIMGWLTHVILLTLMITYNIIVISHFFTHTPWFVSNTIFTSKGYSSRHQAGGEFGRA
ncbi:hypothetical protein [Photorhabdus bodei]|uniref:Uncharacterized protein n=1 Tax=Photorhabdus bodei TaxID=2029681 RepID=A0AAW6BR66_9GAMM|nr:hypothetical protein [Photorhabdus bodei]MDB6375145.1 hypothetical protein [Photorhabdus bodei]